MEKSEQSEPTPQLTQPIPPTQYVNQLPQLPSAFDLIKPCWEAFVLNFKTYILLAILPLLAFIFYIVSISKAVGNNGSSPAHAGTLLISLALLAVIGIAIEPMFIYTTSKSSKGERVSLDDAISGGFRFFFRLIGLGIVVFFFIIGGLILFIVPGIFMAKRYLLSPYIMLDNDLSVGETLKQAKLISKQYSKSIWGILGVNALIGCAGVVPIIGSFISGVLGTIYNIAPAIRYEQIKHLGTTAEPIAPSSPVINPMPPTLA